MGKTEDFLKKLGGGTPSLSRRSFIKTAGAAGSAALLVGCAKDSTETIYLPSDGSGEQETVAIEEKKFSSPCRSNCQSNCRLWAHTRNGRVVKTSMAPFFPPSGTEYDEFTGADAGPISAADADMAYNSYNRACLKGLSSVQRLYSPTRILYPMKQKGQRGNISTFERISWEQALEEISSKVAELYSSDPAILGTKICKFTASGNYGALHGQSGAPEIISAALNSRVMWTSLDMSLPVGLSKVFGASTFPFLTGNELRDIQNAENLFFWGSNMADAHVIGWKFVCDGRVSAGKGGKIKNVVSIDVMTNTTSAKSDYLYTIKPGSDTMVAISMINDIIARNKYNAAFMNEHTVAPFLVNTATHKFVRAEDIAGGVLGDKRFVLWDNNTSNVAYTTEEANKVKYTTPQGVDCDISNTTRTLTGVSGAITAVTAFGLLADHVAQWTPEEAEKYTNISPVNLRKLTDMYTSGPSTIYLGFGTSHHYNSHHFGHAVATLASITGNVGSAGRSVGNFFSRNTELTGQKVPTRGQGLTASSHIMPPQLAVDINKGTNQVKMLMVASANPVSNYVNAKKDYIDTIIPAMDMIVVHDMEMTETARYADILLPAAHWFEEYELFSGSKHPFIVLQEKVAEPMGEALSDMDYARLLSAKLDQKIPGLNVKKWFCVDEDASKPFKTDLDFIKQRVSPTAKRLTFDRLIKEKVVRARHPNDVFHSMSHPNLGVLTTGSAASSGRLEFYNEQYRLFIPWTKDPAVLAAIDNNLERLPTWVEPDEAWSGPTNNAEKLALRSEFPLMFMQEHARWRVHTQWTQVPWLRELDPEPILKICPADAAKYGSIQTGDMVKVSNNRGFAVFKALITDALPEGLVNAPKGWERQLYSTVLKYADGVVGSYNDLTNPKFNTIGIDHMFYDARVKVEKIG